MKKAKIIIVFCLLFLSGCANSNGKSTAEPKNDEAKLSKSRTKLFSSLDYPELSKTEAEKLMEEKFDLMMPSFFEQSLTLTQKVLKIENQAQYAIKSEAENLTIQGVITGKEASSSNYIGSAEAQFQVNQQKQHVYLTKQSILIQNTASDNTLQGESLDLLVRRLGETLELPELDQVMKRAEKKISQVKDESSNQLIEIYNDRETAKKQQGVSRLLTISFDEDKRVKEIYGLISIE